MKRLFNYPPPDPDKKPEGEYVCLACGEVWEGKDLYFDPRVGATGAWTCGYLFCGGVVVHREAPIIEDAAESR